MKRSRKILLTLSGAVLLLGSIAVIVMLTFDWNRAKPWLTDQVGRSIGRSVVIDGDLSVDWRRRTEATGWRSWLPGPHVTATGLTVGNTDWGTSRTFASMKRIELDVALLPLLTHTVWIESIRFSGPHADLEVLADGRDNWTLAADGNTASAWGLHVGRVAFDQGDLTLADKKNSLNVKVQVDALQNSIPFDQLVAQQGAQSRSDAAAHIGVVGGKQFGAKADKRVVPFAKSTQLPQHFAFNLTVTGTFQGRPVTGGGKIGGVFALDASNQPFPVDADVRIGDTRIAFIGTVTDPRDPDGVNLRLWLSGNNLADLYDVLKIPLPDTPHYATEGHLIGRFTHQDKKLRFENFTARVGSSDLRGDLAFETRAPRPLLSGKVESDLLQFRDLAPVIGIDAPADDAQRADAAPATGTRVLPAEPFRPQRWQAIDADVHFSGDHVFRDSELPIHDVVTRVTMNNALLSLDPLQFTLARGEVKSTLQLDGRTVPIKATLRLTARGMQLARMFPQAEAMKASLGHANGEAVLDATGNSIAALLGAAHGELKLVLDSGTLSKGLIETMGLNVPNMIAVKLFGDKQVTINCAAADFVATDGVYASRLFLIDTDIALIEITGNISLRSEQFDLIVNPSSKSVRFLSLHSPIHIVGTFKQPDINLDKKALFTRGAGAIVLGVIAAPIAALLPLTATNFGNTTDDRCATLLTQLQSSAKAPSGVKRVN